jgi:L-histidine Nalpha-methyltransferase
MRRKLKAIVPSEFEMDVRAGLETPGQKELPPKYFYDDLGSALFEAITLLPEYGLTRADLRLLDAHAADLATLASDASVVAELGSGSGEKARHLLPALIPPLIEEKELVYCPIDLSSAALVRCRRDLDDIANLKIVPLEQSFTDGLASASKLRRPGTSMLVLFLGSSIGNFDPLAAVEFLTLVRRRLKRGDVLLLSCDLVKARDRMLAAYDDAEGVTASFNLNVLARINRELGGNFNLSRFQHEVRYDDSQQRIEMHLRSTADQIVRIGDLRVSFKKGETIWTESSYKFRVEQVKSMATQAGFDCPFQWIDEEWPFLQSVLRAE